jgi:hypothetical protein
MLTQVFLYLTTQTIVVNVVTNAINILGWFSWLMVFNTTFNNISVISCGGGNWSIQRKHLT